MACIVVMSMVLYPPSIGADWMLIDRTGSRYDSAADARPLLCGGYWPKRNRSSGFRLETVDA
jgi:hypothetical protein